MTKRLPRAARPHARREGGKTRGDALIEFIAAMDHIAWSARNAKRVLRLAPGPRHVLLPEFAGRLEYQPYGVIGVIGPWNYPILTPMGSITYALAAGNAVVFKPSEYTPADRAVVRRPVRRGRARAPGAADHPRRWARPAPTWSGPGSTRSPSPARPRTARQDHGRLRRDAHARCSSRAAARTR